MNIIFLIGNGFDLNIGLNTSYKDFLNYYLTQNNNSVTINNLKNNIRNEIDNWSNFEQVLGNYTINLNNFSEYEELLDDITKYLQIYLENEVEKIVFDNDSLEFLIQCLVCPESFLLSDYMTNISALKINSNILDISVISFNYTKIFEKFDNKILLKKMRNYNGYNFNIKQIQHIHGYTDYRMVLGVDNIEQISNPNFKNDPSKIIYLVKNEINNTYRLSHHIYCQNLVNNAQIIILFGLSYGQTDKTWWNLIGSRMQEDKSVHLIIFHYLTDYISNGHDGPFIATKELEVKKMFIKKMELVDNLEIQSRITVGINRNIFKIPCQIIN